MPDSTPPRRPRQIQTLRARLAQADGLAFTDILPADQVESALRAEGVGWRHKVFTPVVTLWAFLAQVASPDRCCRAAVARVAAWQAGRGWLWQGRRVVVADGTTLSMPDSAANQRAYPQPDAQEPGLGFPIVRVLVVFC